MKILKLIFPALSPPYADSKRPNQTNKYGIVDHTIENAYIRKKYTKEEVQPVVEHAG